MPLRYSCNYKLMHSPKKQHFISTLSNSCCVVCLNRRAVAAEERENTTVNLPNDITL